MEVAKVDSVTISTPAINMDLFFQKILRHMFLPNYISFWYI